MEKLTATNERRAAQNKRPLCLVSVIYNAARASIAAIYYQDSKHGAAYDFEINDGEGNTASYLETMVSSNNSYISTRQQNDTEASAIIQADLKQYASGLDEIGQKILEMVSAHKTEREIAAEVGISNVAVHKRIVKMRTALEHLRTA